MKTLLDAAETAAEDLVTQLARNTNSDPALIRPFAGLTPFLTGLLRRLYRPGVRLLAVGHVEPEVELAASQADIELIESIGCSPFSGSLEAALVNITSPRDIVYVANPNKVTGANFSLSDLRALAGAVPQGTLIIDEYYFEHLGITGLPLLDSFPRLVILRSFESAQGSPAGGAGYAIFSPDLLAEMNTFAPAGAFDRAAFGAAYAWPADQEGRAARLREVHEESLRIATALTRLGAQSRITAADFLLIRVADPARVGNCLARAKVPVDNLDGYPALRHYLRYRIQSPLVNDMLLQAFLAMPVEAYRLGTFDRRVITMRMSPLPARPDSQDTAADRRVAARHLFGMVDPDTGDSGR